MVILRAGSETKLKCPQLYNTEERTPLRELRTGWVHQMFHEGNNDSSYWFPIVQYAKQHSFCIDAAIWSANAISDKNDKDRHDW